MQECLSSSSLRRKLFLDGQDSHSGSDHSGTSSPERSPATGPMSTGVRAGSLGAPKVASSFLSSPLACDIMATTPSSTVSHGDYKAFNSKCIQRKHLVM